MSGREDPSKAVFELHEGPMDASDDPTSSTIAAARKASASVERQPPVSWAERNRELMERAAMKPAEVTR